MSGTNAGDLAVLKTIEPHVVAVGDPARDLLWTADAAKRLRVYRAPTFELLRTFTLPGVAYRLLLDAKGKRLTAAMSRDVQDWNGGRTRGMGAGDLQAFDLGAAYPDLPEPKK